MLGFDDVVLGFDDVVLGFYDVVLGFDDVVLCFDDVVLCFDDVMRSRHDVMFRFADVVLCFDVVRPEMDVTQETQRGIFRGASRCCCSFASLSFLSCKNQPARTQSKRSDSPDFSERRHKLLRLLNYQHGCKHASPGLHVFFLKKRRVIWGELAQ